MLLQDHSPGFGIESHLSLRSKEMLSGLRAELGPVVPLLHNFINTDT